MDRCFAVKLMTRLDDTERRKRKTNLFTINTHHQATEKNSESVYTMDTDTKKSYKIVFLIRNYWLFRGIINENDDGLFRPTLFTKEL